MIYITVNKYGAITKVCKSDNYDMENSKDLFVELTNDVIKQIMMLALRRC